MTNLLPYIESPLVQMGQIANQYASQNAFATYQERKAANTTRRQLADLALFSHYLAAAGVIVSAEDLMHIPQAWQGVTYGIVDGFVRWMVDEGYAIGSINVRLSTIKSYCKLLAKSGVLSTAEYALIKMVQGYSHKEGRNVDKVREATRKGVKKENPVIITREQANLLKDQPDTPQGRRDALLVCLLLDHGLRCGEVAALSKTALNTIEGTLVFYQQKVDKTQTHELTRDTLIAAQRYFEACRPEMYLLLGSRKGGEMVGRMSERAITDRMRVLCQRIGIQGASAHDARHAWATFAIKGGTDIKSLQDAGGWASAHMPLRYAASHKIANKGVKLG